MTKIRFSKHHGQNIELLDGAEVAFRKCGFDNGITFSDRPLKPNEIFMLEIEDIECGWCGHLRLGFTVFTPADHVPLPANALPDLFMTGLSWITSINRSSANIFHSFQMSRQNNLRLDTTLRSIADGCRGKLVNDVGSRIGIMYTVNGKFIRVHVIVNGIIYSIPHSIMFPILYDERPLYAIADIFGNTKQVRIIQLDNVPRLSDFCRSVILHRLSSPEDVDKLPLPQKLRETIVI